MCENPDLLISETTTSSLGSAFCSWGSGSVSLSRSEDESSDEEFDESELLDEPDESEEYLLWLPDLHDDTIILFSIFFWEYTETEDDRLEVFVLLFFEISLLITFLIDFVDRSFF